MRIDGEDVTGIVSRVAAHYDARDVPDPHAAAADDVRTFRRAAPRLWRHWYDDTRLSSVQVGDRIYALIDQWLHDHVRGGVADLSLKNFLVDQEEELLG